MLYGWSVLFGVCESSGIHEMRVNNEKSEYIIKPLSRGFFIGGNLLIENNTKILAYSGK